MSIDIECMDTEMEEEMIDELTGAHIILIDMFEAIDSFLHPPKGDLFLNKLKQVGIMYIEGKIDDDSDEFKELTEEIKTRELSVIKFCK